LSAYRQLQVIDLGGSPLFMVNILSTV